MQVYQATSSGQESRKVDHVTITFEHRNSRPLLEIGFDTDDRRADSPCYLTTRFTAADLAAINEFMEAAEKFRNILNGNQ